MSDSMHIEVREGETMVEAMTRTAKEQALANPEKNANGVTMIQKPSKTKRAAAGEGRSKSPRPTSVTASTLGGDPNEGAKDDMASQIYSAIHVYQREGEGEGKTRWNASHEREMHGPNTLVFCHLHSFGAKCDSRCTVKMETE